MPNPFRKYIWISITLHIVGFFLFLFSNDLFNLVPRKDTKITFIRLTKGTGETPDPFPFKKSKTLPESTIREQKDAFKEIKKDKKGIDKKSVQADKKQKKEPTQKERVSDKGAINLDKKPPPKKEDKTIDDALARINQQLESRKVEMEAAQIEKEGSGQSPYGSLDVTNGETNPALIAYTEAIKRKVNQNWVTIPKEGAAGQSLKTVIEVIIDSQGNIVSVNYETKSGDPSFDLLAMRAIERSSPFPIPPDTIRDMVMGGISIGFNPQSVVGSF